MRYNMEEKTYFQSEFVYDLPVHKEASKLNREVYGRNIFSHFKDPFRVL